MRSVRMLHALAALLSLGCFSRFDFAPLDFEPYQASSGWVVTGEQAAALHRQGALFLDARDPPAFEAFHVKGAWPVRWETFSEPTAPRQGLLLVDDAVLADRLRAAGVSASRPVVVVGDPVGGWGEDGRLVWTLRALGHPRAVLVDGGYDALLRAGVPLSKRPQPPAPGDFVVRRDAALTLAAGELGDLLADGSIAQGTVTVVDSREQREFDGETPYGESRGGHIPGAVHLHYAELLNDKGYLLSRTQLLERLTQRGLVTDKPVITYCSGGVRSAWLLVVLKDLGFSDVRNYAGSMWEWSAGDPASYPLE